MFKKIVIFLCLSCALMHAQAPVAQKFDVVVSLGGSCQTAGNLNGNRMRFQAFPFDWLITSATGIAQFILHQGKDFLEPEYLLFDIKYYCLPRGILDTRYGFYLFHDFEYVVKQPTGQAQAFSEVDVLNYAAIKAKYARRSERFFKLLSSDKKVLFVRLGINRGEAALLDDVIHMRYPQLDYLILALDNTEEIKQDWQLARVKNYYIHRSSIWSTKVEDWRQLLQPFVALLQNTAS